MKFTITMAIDFYQPNEASVNLTSSDSVQVESLATLALLFCCFTIRSLLILGESDTGYALAMSLSEAGDNLEEITNPRVANIPKIVDYRGISGQKKFTGKLIYTKRGFQFNMGRKGFGFFKPDFGLYSINSVMLFLKFLVLKGADTSGYIIKLTTIVKNCAQVFITRQLSPKTEKELIASIMGLAGL